MYNKLDLLNKNSFELFDDAMNEIKEIGNSFDSSNKEYLLSLHACHSNNIEGSTYTIDETLELLKDEMGFVPKNKSRLETTEILSTSKAYTFLESKFKIGLDLSIDLIKETQRIVKEHTQMYTNPTESPAGQFKIKQNRAGETMFAMPEEVEQLMNRLMDEYKENNNEHPLYQVAAFHRQFIMIHPFPDGNGRTARLLTNFQLWKRNYPDIVFFKENKQEYIQALKNSSKTSKYVLLVKFLAEQADKFRRIESQKKKLNLSGDNPRGPLTRINNFNP